MYTKSEENVDLFFAKGIGVFSRFTQNNKMNE